MALYACLEDGGVCRRQGHCEVQHVWAWAQSRFLKALEDFTLFDLVTGRAADLMPDAAHEDAVSPKQHLLDEVSRRSASAAT